VSLTQTLTPSFSAKDYLALLKPRVMSLVLFSGFTGLYLAPSSLPLETAFWSLICIALGAGASGSINMWYDSDIDAIMKRTVNRPIPRGSISPENALRFGVTLSWFSVGLMALKVGLLASSLLAITIGFYVFVYTMWLKRLTPQNIVIGGAAGAFPPMIGWACVEQTLSLEPLLLFAIIFIWTPPHFWALCLYHGDDYAKANIPMMSVVKGIPYTKKQIVLYTLALILITFAPYALSMRGTFYGISVALLNGGFLYLAIKVYQNDSPKPPRQLFGYSILYLFMIFVSMIIDKMIQGF